MSRNRGMRSVESNRSQQVGELIQRALSHLLPRDIADPRLRGLTVTHVSVARDLSYAKISVTQLSLMLPETELLKILKKAAPRFRYLLAQQLNLRTTPALHFRYDHFV